MRTFDIGRFYVTFIGVTPGAPLAHTFTVDEMDGECRTSTALFIRMWPLRIAVGTGMWKSTGMTPTEKFRSVFSSRNIELTGEVGDRVRQMVAAHVEDPDQEWEILQMLDLDS